MIPDSIEFMYDRQKYTLKYISTFRYMIFKLYQEGRLIHKEKIRLTAWYSQKLSHQFRVPEGNTFLELQFFVGQTEEEPLAYALLINQTLISGVDPQRLKEVDPLDLPQEEQRNPFSRALTYLSPVIIVIISDTIDNKLEPITHYLMIALVSGVMIAFVEVLFDKVHKAIRSLLQKRRQPTS
ncbi:MAG: hypothetical protein WHT84_02320 [Breznakiellaceae bacterium]